MDIFAPYEQAHRQEGQARQRMEEAAPMAARKAPGAAFDAAQRFMRGDVVDVTPAPQQLQVM